MELYGCFDLYSSVLLLPGTVKSTGKPCTDGNNEGEWRLIETQVTDANGAYLFDALHDGYYDVRVDTTTLPTNFTSTIAEPGLAGDGAGFTCGTCDNQWNADENLASLNDINNSGGGEDITRINFGYLNTTNLGAVTGYVWYDADRDGVWDADEEPIPNVTVSLTCTGSSCPPSIPDVTTDENGFYVFSDLPTGANANYQVVVTQPSGTTQSGDPDGTLDNQTTTSFTLGANEVKGTYDFGYYGGVSLGDTVYVDWDGDGSQESGEEGLGGVTVDVYRDANGNGSYDLGTDTLVKSVSTLSYDVVEGYIDLNGNGTPNETGEDLAELHGIPVIDGALDMNNDGFITAADNGWFAGYQVVGGRLDVDGDTDADADDNGTLLGKYQVPDLPGEGNDYFVMVNESTLPAGYVQTGDPDATLDSETIVTLYSSDDWSADFGYQPQGTSSIGDTVWLDDNANGLLDSTESGVSGVTVNLYQDQDGDGVIDAEDALVGTRTTLEYAVVDGYLDLNGNGTPNETSEDLADLHGVSVIDGQLDLDGSGAIDSNDDGDFAGFAVIDGLIDFDASGAVTTDDDGDLLGRYHFRDLMAGNYIVEIPSANFGSGQPLYSQTQSYDPDSATVFDNQDVVTLGSDEVYTSADFGFTSSAIGDLIWQDNNADGVWQSNEPGLPNVVLELYCDPNNTGDWQAPSVTACGTTTTDADGYYLFGGLSADNYIVKVADSNFNTGGALENYTLTGDPNSYNTDDPTNLSCTAAGAQECDGVNWLAEISVQNGDGSTTTFPGLQLGQNDMSSDFGYKPPTGVIGDTVWIDGNGNGVYDDGEKGIPYVTVQLCTDASCSNVVDTIETDENGNYTFAGLEDYSVSSTEYYVKVDTSDPDFPSGLTATYDRDGTADSLINNIRLTSGAVSSVNGVACTDCDLEMDFGYRYNGTYDVAGTVFFDAGQDGGLYSSGTDSGMSNVPVYLWKMDCGGNDVCGDAGDSSIYVASTATLFKTVNGQIDLNGDGTPDTGDDGFWQGVEVIDGWLDLDGDGAIETNGEDDGAFLGYTVINGALDVDNDGIIETNGQDDADAGSYNFFDLPAGDYRTALNANSFQLNGMTLYYEPDEQNDADAQPLMTDTTNDDGDLNCTTNAYSNDSSPGCTTNAIVRIGASGDSDILTQDYGFHASMDLGDLPTSYDFDSNGTKETTYYYTPFSYEGPMHINTSGGAVPTIYLGSVWDSEADGSPDEDAGKTPDSGDDNDNGGLIDDDEDGIVFTDTWYQGKPASLQIIVTDNDTEYTPYVAGWFDWNQDGQFQSTELIKFGNLEAGTHNRTIDVPSTSSLGRIYMRFRIYATQSPPDVLSPTGAVTNGEVEDYWQTNNEPTAVDLVSFSAAPEGGAVRLTWETATEIDNLGFHLYRSTSPSGPWSRLNNSLIPTQNPGASFGAIYSWLDEDVEPNVTYYYRLEDVDASGKVTSHGPVEATLDGDPTAVRLARFSAPRDAGFSLAFLGLAALLVALRNRRRR